MIAEKILQTLEYPRILQSVASYTVSGAAAEQALGMRPDTDYALCVKNLQYTAEAEAVLFHYLLNPVSAYDKAGEIFDKLAVRSVLSFRELLRVAGILRSSRVCRSVIVSVEEGALPLLRERVSVITAHQSLENRITDAILSEDEMADTASEKLYQIRKGIRKANQDVKDKLGSLIKSNGKYLQDAIVTMRQGRYVIPVKTEYRGSVSGLVHDQSASRSTVFIEPMQVVELNNTLRTLEIEEKAEIEEILYNFTCEIAIISEELKRNYETLIQLDLIFAKAVYADKSKAKRPLLNSNGRVALRRARHPLIASGKVVPIDIELGTNFDILIITGPNTGGKTVCLKTVGLFTLMAMTGMFIPAEEESELSFFNDIFCDIGDEQSIENSLSTFSSHMANITHICDNAGKSSLVLLDEVGAGTDPEEGAALAIAIVDYLKNAGVKLLTTTHYGALKEYSIRGERVENASMEFDPDTFAPTFKLNIGVPGSSKALEIALRLGLKAQIVEVAKTKLSPEKLELERVLENADRLMTQTAREREEVSAKQRELNEKLATVNAEREKLAQKHEKLLQNAKAEARRVVAETANEAEALLAEIKEILNAEEIGGGELIAAGKLKKQLENKMYEIAKEEERLESGFTLLPFRLDRAQKGQKVYVKSLKNTGILLSVRDKNGQVPVAFGNINSNVKVSDLAELAVSAKKKEQKSDRQVAVSVKRSVTTAPVKMEINLLGQTVYEAEANVGEFLESAALNGIAEVKIIHGVGTGKLRAGVHALLKNNALVEEFRLGAYGEGEKGVTIVKLK